jgi:hypothetical protein
MEYIFHVVCHQFVESSVPPEIYEVKLLFYVKYNWPARWNSPPPQHHKDIQRLKLWTGRDEWHMSSISTAYKDLMFNLNALTGMRTAAWSISSDYWHKSWNAGWILQRATEEQRILRFGTPDDPYTLNTQQLFWIGHTNQYCSSFPIRTKSAVGISLWISQIFRHQGES